jgi:hypothetical protein
VAKSPHRWAGVHNIVAQVVSLEQAARLRTNDQACFHAPVTRKLIGRDSQPRVMEEALDDEATMPFHSLHELFGGADRQCTRPCGAITPAALPAYPASGPAGTLLGLPPLWSAQTRSRCFLKPVFMV